MVKVFSSYIIALQEMLFIPHIMSMVTNMEAVLSPHHLNTKISKHIHKGSKHSGPVYFKFYTVMESPVRGNIHLQKY